MSSDPSSIYLSIEELCEYDNDEGLSESEPLERLNTIILKNPTAARLAIVNGKEEGWTLLHQAAFDRSLEFCKVLVEMDSGLLTVKATDSGSLPIHIACDSLNFGTAKYLYGLFPESINIPGEFGRYPLHCLLRNYDIYEGDDEPPEGFEEMLRFLLERDQGAVLKADNDGNLLMHLVNKYCGSTVVELVYDAYPYGISIRNIRGLTPLDVARRFHNHDAVAFFESQIEFVRQAFEVEIPNENGELPIHQTLSNANAAKGTIKLMAAANPGSLIVTDSQGRTPLHIAFTCGFGDLDIVKGMVEGNKNCLTMKDLNQDLPLHMACRLGKCDVVNYILEKSEHGADVPNGDDDIPIQLLLFDAKFKEQERDSLEYVRATSRLFRVNPVLSMQALSKPTKSTEKTFFNEMN
jgi:ankyrin repeat protein